MGTRIQKMSFAVFVAGCIWSGAGFAKSYTVAWDVHSLAASPGIQVELRDRKGRMYKRVKSRQMRYLYAVETSMERVSETPAKLEIVPGRKPNAFAGEDLHHEPVVAINFAMLDMIGLDMHAAAALIGHELAHLRLNHGDERKSRNSSNQTMRILSGALLGGMGLSSAQSISDLSFTAMERKYDRKEESQADYLGAIWAVEAGYEVSGAVRLQEKLAKRSGNTSLAFLSTHPTGPERIARLKSLERRLSTK